MKKEDMFKKLSRLTFEDFKNLAKDDTLSNCEKIGFPDEYRKGHEANIVRDIIKKLPEFSEAGKTVLDIGCGCGDVPRLLIEHCKGNKSRLLLVDSQEMLNLLLADEVLRKFPCKFPDCPVLFDEYQSKIDACVVYSVLQHIVLDANVFNFIDKILELLVPGGKLLLGDIPNISKSKRFFSSPSGIASHQKFTGKNDHPVVDFMKIEHERIDDSIVFSILQRYRNFGFETYLLPQPVDLPIWTRREDILIVKPR